MNTELHSIIQHNYHQIFRDKETRRTKLPFHLEREFTKYLKCQNPLYGMPRLKCPHCAHEKFIAFSCKGRTLCPSCTGRKMADTGKHLIEEVIPVACQKILDHLNINTTTIETKQSRAPPALDLFDQTFDFP